MTGRSTSPTRRMYLMDHKPELGINIPYELNEDQYEAALDLLRAQRKLVGRYWHDAFIQIDDFKNEGVVASGSWPFQVNLLQADGAADRLDHPAGRRDRLGRHHHDACRRRATRTAPTCGWSTRWPPTCRVGPLGLVRREPVGAGRLHRRARHADGRGLHHQRHGRFRARSSSGRRRSAKCESQGECVPYYRWVSDYIGVIGGR